MATLIDMNAKEREVTKAKTKPVKVRTHQRKPRSKRSVVKTAASMPKAAWIVGAATVGLLALSLYHLVTGILMVTGSSVFEAWCMGVGIDVMFVAVEGVLLTAPHDAVDHVTAHIMIAVTIGVSTVMNIIGFAENAPEAWRYLAAGFGALVPSLIYGGTRLIAKMASR